jgi:hypothetical protein
MQPWLGNLSRTLQGLAFLFWERSVAPCCGFNEEDAIWFHQG